MEAMNNNKLPDKDASLLLHWEVVCVRHMCQRVLTITGNSVKQRFLRLAVSLTPSGLFQRCYLRPPGTQRFVCSNSDFNFGFVSSPARLDDR